MDDNNEGAALEETIPVESANSEENGAMVIINLESMIKSHIASIDRLQEDLEKHSSMLKDIFDNDPTFKEHSDKAKEASKIKANTRREILKRPQAADLDNKIKSFKSQIKETQDALSDYLKEFQRLSGVTEIEGEDGEVREIILVPKLIKKSSAFR